MWYSYRGSRYRVGYAWSEDGVIEGTELRSAGDPWLLAVQWHPEDEVEGALFRGFAAAVR